MRKEIYSNWPYIFWLLFYFIIFWIIFGANTQSFIWVFVIYGVSLFFACSPIAEGLWRSVSGVRFIALESEKKRLLPLFEQVYSEAIKIDPSLSENIELYIQEDMEINAFAFGRTTLVLTKGSIELLNDDCLKGLIAHELGHFSHYDTVVLLFATVGNMFMSLFMKMIRGITNVLLFIVRNKDSTFTICFRILYWLINGIYKTILFFGDLILMAVSREHEYMADEFAGKCGFGIELAEVLGEIYQVSINTPNSVIEQLRSTHPPLVDRIERLEEAR